LALFQLSCRVFKPAPSLKPRQKPKILAAHRYLFSVNALIGKPMENYRLSNPCAEAFAGAVEVFTNAANASSPLR